LEITYKAVGDKFLGRIREGQAADDVDTIEKADWVVKRDEGRGVESGQEEWLLYVVKFCRDKLGTANARLRAVDAELAWWKSCCKKATGR